MSSLGQIETDLKSAQSLVDQLGLVLQSTRSDSSSITGFAQQLETLHTSFSRICSALVKNAEEVEKRQERLDLLEKELGRRQMELELKEKEFDEFIKGMDRRVAVIESKGKDSAATSISEENERAQSETQQLVETDPMCSADQRNELDLLCKNLNASNLRLHLSAHVTMEDLPIRKVFKEVFKALQFASDPARLVFNTVRYFYHASPGISAKAANKASCILLMKRLMEVSPVISTAVKEEALQFADHWKGLVDVHSEPLAVFAFAMFLVTYKLVSSFAVEELLALFGTVYWLDENLNLCRALSLEDKIPGVVKTLLKKKPLEAVRYMCACDLTDRYPPVPLLELHLEIARRIASERCKRQHTINGQNKLAYKEINALKCISDCNLEAEYSPAPLEQRIHQLQLQRAERKWVSIALISKKERATLTFPVTAKKPEHQVVRKRATISATIRPQLPQRSQRKRPKLISQTVAVSDADAATHSADTGSSLPLHLAETLETSYGLGSSAGVAMDVSYPGAGPSSSTSSSDFGQLSPSGSPSQYASPTSIPPYGLQHLYPPNS